MNEAGQDKLRSAVEWGVFRRHCGERVRRGRLLNLKWGLSRDFFDLEDRGPEAISWDGAQVTPSTWLADFDPASISGIYALDFFQMQPDLEKGMGDLSRVLETGGSLFLNFFSLDHFQKARLFTSPDGSRSLEEISAIPDNAVSPNQIAGIAKRHGLSVRACIPYSSFYGNALWLDLMPSRFRWERILDWLTTDRTLFDLALFLEETLVARLGCASAPRFILVLEKTDREKEPTPSPESRDQSWNRTPSATTAEGLSASIGVPFQRLRELLDGHLGTIRNRVFLRHLWKLVQAHFQPAHGEAWALMAPERTRDENRKWDGQEQADAACLRLVRGWHRIPEVDRILRHKGIPLAPGLEYDQVRDVLAGVFGFFGDGKEV